MPIEKPDGTIVITVHLTFKPDRDAVMIRLIRSAPPRHLAQFIKEAMRNGIPEFQNEEPGAVEDEIFIDESELGIDL